MTSRRAAGVLLTAGLLMVPIGGRAGGADRVPPGTLRSARAAEGSPHRLAPDSLWGKAFDDAEPGAERAASARSEDKLKRPRLDLRATPRFAFSPVTIFLTAELTGGDDVEEYHCPEIEWDWDDGGKSQHEADCTPFQPGVTKIERRYTAEHEYRRAGVYNIKATLRRTGKSLAAATARVTVRPGLGDRTIERD